MRCRSIQLNPNRDLPLLEWLWRWKVSSTQVLHDGFFAKRSPKTSYERLRELAAFSYIQRRCTADTALTYWQLTAKGFRTIKDRVPGLTLEAFQPDSPLHDLIAAGLHFEGWLDHLPDGAELISEQQLKCCRPESWDEWVPRLQSRRPDGYWFRGWAERSRVIALEVELFPKSQAWFNEILASYAWSRDVDAVIWVVQHPSVIKRVTQFQTSEHQRAGAWHTIIKLDDVINKGWAATMNTPIDGAWTLAELLNPEGQNNDRILRPLRNLGNRKFPLDSQRYGAARQVASL